jgi:Bacterial Ig-like domain (group 3)
LGQQLRHRLFEGLRRKLQQFIKAELTERRLLGFHLRQFASRIASAKIQFLGLVYMWRRLSFVSQALAFAFFGCLTVLQAAAATTTTTITPSANPVTVGQPETIVFAVKSSGAAPLTGDLVIQSGNAAQIHSLTNGTYTITRPHERGPSRTETILARYLGDPNNAPSAVATLSLVITEAGGATKIALGSSANPTYIGQVTTYTAVVLGSESSPPTGTVSFNFGDSSAVVVRLAATGVATAIHTYTKAGNFTVSATYSGDKNNPGVTAPTVTQVVTGVGASPALTFVPIPPCRVMDTRNPTGPFGGPALANKVTRNVAMPQSGCNIPSTAAAYSVNITAVPQGTLNVLEVWPSGQPTPTVSLLNSYDGRVKANAAIVPAGTSGAISLLALNVAPTNVIVDINGYFAPSVPSGLAFFPIAPCRVADTRSKVPGPLGAPSLVGGQARAFPVRSAKCNLPAAAKAYSFNFTGISKTGIGALTTWPTGQKQPITSTLNFKAAIPIANAAIVSAGTGGDVSVFSNSDADVVIDVNGYFAPASVGGTYLYTVPSCRALDTRNNPIPPFPGVFTVSIQASVCAPSTAAAAYVLNATVVPPGPVSLLTLWASGTSQPEATVLNAPDGAVTSNMAIVSTNNGAIDAFSPDVTQLLLDLSGYFAP